MSEVRALKAESAAELAVRTRKAEDLEARGRSYESQGVPLEATTAYQAALGVLQPHRAFPTTTYRLLRHIAYLQSVAGDLDQAIATTEQQLEFVTREGKVPHPREGVFWVPAAAMADLSWMHYLRGDVREALRYAQSAYDRRFQDRLLRSTIALIRKLRGNAESDLLKFEAAEKDYVAALEILEGTDDRREISNLTYNLGCGAGR